MNDTPVGGPFLERGTPQPAIELAEQGGHRWIRVDSLIDWLDSSRIEIEAERAQMDQLIRAAPDGLDVDVVRRLLATWTGRSAALAETITTLRAAQEAEPS